jgi:glutamate/tyrosine decarboxylase-like PLP-dependent enzyme
MAGSRPGALLASCWATLMFVGKKGYVDAARDILQATQKITRGKSDRDQFCFVV